ncbi:hypothetical protein AC578_3253 [Pseudocercospora eumusae]|uniref:Uncharacterized protein n=1 Tax=Pseudocercospora eumusae TaxID=321146 RepID=A0A139H1W7_9PEZI|nr:hypothetical protein AC578_3253 [Pseudocercospora eumusae]
MAEGGVGQAARSPKWYCICSRKGRPSSQPLSNRPTTAAMKTFQRSVQGYDSPALNSNFNPSAP